MDKSLFKLDELQELEALEVRGGNTDSILAQTGCPNNAYGCGVDADQTACQNNVVGCTCRIPLTEGWCSDENCTIIVQRSC